MAFEDNATTGETRSAHPSVLAAASPGERRWWQSGFWAHMLGILFLFGFLQYWVHEFWKPAEFWALVRLAVSATSSPAAPALFICRHLVD